MRLCSPLPLLRLYSFHRVWAVIASLTCTLCIALNNIAISVSFYFLFIPLFWVSHFTICRMPTGSSITKRLDPKFAMTSSPLDLNSITGSLGTVLVVPSMELPSTLRNIPRIQKLFYRNQPPLLCWILASPRNVTKTEVRRVPILPLVHTLFRDGHPTLSPWSLKRV
jgi:hypothetical protein